MRDVRGTSFTILLVVACALSGCPDDDGDNDNGDVLDAGMIDSGLSAPQDAALPKPDARDTTNSACHSWTPASETMCGGTHCLQSLEQLTVTASAGGACAGDNNLKSLCSLKGPNAVGDCSLINVTNRANIRSCSATKLGDAVTPACLDCYMKSADCAFEQCIVECINGTSNVRCDNCRLNKGCAKIFYDCAGISIPPS